MTDDPKGGLHRGQDDINSQSEIDGPQAFAVAFERHGLIVLSINVPCNGQKPCFGSEWCNLIPEVFPFDARIMETTSQGEKQWQKITSREC